MQDATRALRSSRSEAIFRKEYIRMHRNVRHPRSLLGGVPRYTEPSLKGHSEQPDSRDHPVNTSRLDVRG